MVGNSPSGPVPSLAIALISEHASPLAEDIGSTDSGGQNVYVRELATALAASGHQVTVYTRRTAASQPERVGLVPGADIVHVAAGPARELPKEDLAPFMGDFGDQLALAWRDHPPDIAHAHYWMSGVAALAGARRTEIPVVATFHALAADRLRHLPSATELRSETILPENAFARERERERTSMRVGAERTVAQVADAIIALTREEAEALADLAGVAPGKITVVPVGVDTTLFTPDGPTLARGTRPRLVTVSRLVERKGVRTVIEALAFLPDCELLIAGGPDPGYVSTDPVIRTLRSHAHLHGVLDRIRFLGRVPHSTIPALLRSADAFVTAPYYEPFGTAALEAAACGVPVVATAVGGLREHVVDGVTGYLITLANSATHPSAPHSPAAAALASAIATLVADPAQRARLGAAGSRHSARYAWPGIARRVIDVYSVL
jgi:D-inositol-3-phosphate glycosyltransferase